jgi:iron complex outermembrane receptor protein
MFNFLFSPNGKSIAYFLSSFISASFLVSFSAYAQSSLPNIVVTGSRFEENLNEVPANVKVITREEIANSTSSNIPDVLSQIGGLMISGTDQGQLNLNATVDMGGYGATANSTTLVLVDGQRINPIDSGPINWESIPIDSIERIEILQGGASVQYGNGAMGGVINIITNGGQKNLNQLSTTYGSYGTLINNAIFRNTVDKTTLQLSGNTSNSQGWRQNSNANAYSFDAKVVQAFSGADKIYADLFYAYTNSQNPGAVIGQVGEGNPQNARYKNIGSNTTTNNTGIRFGGTKEIGEKNLFELDGYYTNKTSFFYNPYFNSQASYDSSINNYGANINTSNNKAEGWQVNLSPRVKMNFDEYGTTVIGAEFNQGAQNNSATYGTLAQQAILANQGADWGYYNNLISSTSNARLTNRSGYIISRLPLTSMIDLNGGYRNQTQSSNAYDNSPTSVNGPVTSGRTYSANAGDVALNFNLSKAHRLYVKWNQSYRFPNTDEFWGLDANSNRVFNGILAPQTAQTYEIGGNINTDIFKSTGSIFTSVTQNEITYNATTGANYNSPYSVNRRGIVLDNSANITNRITIAGGGKYQKSFYANGPYAGYSVPVSPDLLLNARANYLIDSNWTVGAVVNYVGNQHYDSTLDNYQGLALMPAYTVGDVYASYKFDRWDTKLTIKNVGNARYSTYGVWAKYVGLPDGTNVNTYAYYPSDGRTIFITAKYNFQ